MLAKRMKDAGVPCMHWLRVVHIALSARVLPFYFMVSGLLFLSGVFERKIYSAAGLSQLDLMRLWTWCPTTH